MIKKIENLYDTSDEVIQDSGDWIIKAGELITDDGMRVIAWQVGINDGGEFYPYYTASSFEAIVNWMSCNHFNCTAKQSRYADEFMIEDDGKDEEDE